MASGVVYLKKDCLFCSSYQVILGPRLDSFQWSFDISNVDKRVRCSLFRKGQAPALGRGRTHRESEFRRSSPEKGKPHVRLSHHGLRFPSIAGIVGIDSRPAGVLVGKFFRSNEFCDSVRKVSILCIFPAFRRRSHHRITEENTLWRASG